jgi:hypothetical protein
MIKLKFLVIVLFLVCGLHFTVYSAYGAKDDKKPSAPQGLCASFAQAKEMYFKENKYTEFVEFLKVQNPQEQASAACCAYYTALARYQQLKYLEEAQSWDEYFSQGNTYRDEITANLQKAIEGSSAKEAVNIYARLLSWQFHKDMQDNLYEQALAGLADALSEYAKETGDPAVIKAVADKLSSYEEKGRAKELYKIYAQKITASDIKDEDLKNIAAGFYGEGNIALAENFYDAYIGRIVKAAAAKKEKPVPALIEVAKLFTYKDAGAQDPFYAEKIFKQIEELSGKEAFDEELVYLRAFNLEKIKEYPQAKDIYLDLAQRFPGGRHADEAAFKAAIIYSFILRDTKSGRELLEKLAAKEAVSPQVASALYQLGLLAQWEGDTAKAKEYYGKVIERSKGVYSESASAAQARIKEIDEIKPLDYNLRTFLDLALKDENEQFDMTKVELKAHPSVTKKGESASVTATPFLSESGCMQVETQFLWAGDTGSAAPTFSDATFSPAYSDPGTKIIAVTVVSPSGTLDRSLIFVDVNN